MTSSNDRIARLELVLGTLITWLHGTFSDEQVRQIMAMLEDDDPLNIPAILRRPR